MDPLLGTRLVFILGLVNLLGLLGLFLSCRCLGGKRAFSSVLRFRAFARFYRYHCYYWAILGLSVATHLGIAISVLGIPISA